LQPEFLEKNEMNSCTKALRSLPVILCLLCLGITSAGAQTVTTGNIDGIVTDTQGGVLPGATVVAVHTPTGTTYEAVTDGDGRYNILNVRVGPYNVSVSMNGFRKDEQQNIAVALGETKTIPFKLQIETVAETVEVIGQSPLIDSSVAGTADNISNMVKEALPTINRSITDIVRVSPLFSAQGSGAGDGASVVAVAGNSFRYNSLQIDGAVNNDLFGLASSAGSPGGTAETQPISLDAIQELQLVVSPYDVRQGGFSGGGINAITKSGTNAFHGTGFFFGRNQDWVGNGVTDQPISTFKDTQWGGSIGGPVVKNAAFFFGTLDYGRKDRPSGFSIGESGQNWGNDLLVDRFLADLAGYGYTPSADPKAEFIKATNSDKYFVRGDFNIAKNNQLTIRNNYIDALNDIGTITQATYRMPDAFYRYESKTNSTVGQLNSTFGAGVNELRVTYTRVRDKRVVPTAFPQVTVTLAPGRSVIAGTEQFSTRNAIDQDIVELNEAFTWLKGRHTFTVGTHNEFLKLKNLFIRDNFGTYSFANLETFEQGFAQQFDHSFSATSNPLQAAEFRVNQYGFYAGDQWRATNALTLSYGVRMDAPVYPTKPTANPVAQATFGYATDVVPNDVQWSPRVGFNLAVGDNNRQQIRGGVGMFTGRPAYVWISNQFANTGIEFTRIGASFSNANRIPFVTDPNNQPHTVTGASATAFANEIDVIDPDFAYPSILRGNLGWDRELYWGMIGSAEFLWSKTIDDIKYQNLNFAPLPGVTGVGGRPFFGRQVSTLSDVILLENSGEGYNWNISYEIRRPFTNGFFFAGSYAYGEAKTIMDGTSDQAASNWGNVYVPGDPNNPPLVRSNFDPGHRINLSAAYDISLGKGYMSTVSVFYSAQSGRPYTLTTNRDVNGDNRGTNDLLYIPGSPTELTFAGGTYEDFIAFIEADECLSQYIGQIIPRNACRAPWSNWLDTRVNFQLPFRRVKAEISLDIFNLLNLFNSDKGLFQYESFGQLSVFQPIPTTVTPTAPLTGYNIATLTSPTFTKYLRDDLRSRWQMQLGARIRF
jgi:Carboxypeptidase regulatory-like domain